MPEQTERPARPWERWKTCPLRHTRKVYQDGKGDWVRGDDELFVALVASNGRVSFHLRCKGCDLRSSALPTRILPLWGLKPTDIADVKINEPNEYDACSVRNCDTVPTEYHHFAPYNTFGSAANDWPCLPLCRPHHVEWHQTMDGYKWHRKRAA